MSKSIKPAHDIVSVRIPEEKELVSTGGIVLPDSRRLEGNIWVEVVDVGEKCQHVTPGDKVLISRNGGVSRDTGYNIGDLKLIREEDILLLEK